MQVAERLAQVQSDTIIQDPTASLSYRDNLVLECLQDGCPDFSRIMMRRLPHAKAWLEPLT